MFAPDAVTAEEAPTDAGAEFRRKVRVTNRSLSALLNLRAALWTSGWYSVELVSHKLLRHLAPTFMLATLGTSLALLPVSPVYLAAALGQATFYGLALAGYAARASPLGKRRLLSVPYFFCFANLAALVGLSQLARGRRLAVWDPRGGAARQSHSSGR